MREVAADAVVVVHFGFLAFVVLGGYLCWRWPRLLPAHLLAVAYGLGIVTIGWPCPLTDLENALRGEALPGGFIATYLTGVMYPGDRLVEARVLAGALIAVSWLGLLRRRRGRGRRAVAPGRSAGGRPPR